MSKIAKPLRSYFSLFFIIFVFSILCFLGIWQSYRAYYKYHLQQQFQEHTQVKALRVNNLHQLKDLKLYQRVHIKGHFVDRYTFLLANKFHNHQLGYQIITPFVLDTVKKDAGKKNLLDRNNIILINRGWIASNHSLPKATASIMEVEGYIYTISRKPFHLGPAHMGAHEWPLILQWFDLHFIQETLELVEQPAVVLLTSNLRDGLIRDWHAVEVDHFRHIGYAIQWFLLAVAALIIYYIFQRKKGNK